MLTRYSTGSLLTKAEQRIHFFFTGVKPPECSLYDHVEKVVWHICNVKVKQTGSKVHDVAKTHLGAELSGVSAAN